MTTESIDPALRVLAPIASRWADDILDLRDAALNAGNPGTCVRCYYTIYGKVADRWEDKLLPLRRWLENHVEIVAKDELDNELERLPVSLNGRDLESYCEEMMAEFRENRVYQSDAIRLSFCFRSEQLSAAA